MNLAVDELMKDETYAKLLKTKLGAATMEEVRAEVRNQLVNDPTFMNQRPCPGQEMAADEASKRVNGGWRPRRCWTVCRPTCCPASAAWWPNQISKLGSKCRQYRR